MTGHMYAKVRAINGYVYDNNKKPISNVMLQFHAEQGEEFTTITNKKGFYTTPKIADGKYRILLINGPKMSSCSIDVKTSTNKRALYNFVISFGTAYPYTDTNSTKGK